MANTFMRFPEGKKKAVTLSYDDGVEQDIHLIEIMKKNGLKGTFNINSGCFALEGTVYPKGTIYRRMTKAQCLKLYRENGMEVAVHGRTHPWLDKLPEGMCTYEILQDRINLEQELGTIVRGMAYPFGTYNDSVVETVKKCGIAYARTTISTENFELPKDWLRMPATCHHNHPRLMELAEKFTEEVLENSVLFYLWGHSYEFEEHDNWNVIEEFAEYIGNREDIWYATNIEIYDYAMSFSQLIFSADGSRVYNPTDKVLYFQTAVNSECICVKPGENRSV